MKQILSFLFISYISFFQSQNNVQVSTGLFFEGEPYLAIDPNNHDHLVASWMGFQLNEDVVIKTSVSEDGGITWSAPIWQPHEVNGNYSADVSMNYDSNGDLYMCYIDYDKTSFTNGTVILRKSTNGGYLFGPARIAININDCPNKLCIDRPWMVIDTFATSPNRGTVYITSVNANNTAIVTAPYHPYIVSTSNGGLSFTALRTIDETGYLAGSTLPQPMASPSIQSNGNFTTLYPSYEPINQGPLPYLYKAESIDGGQTFVYGSAYSQFTTGVTNTEVKRGPVFRVDPTNSNHWVYFYLKNNTPDIDIYLIESYNAGSSWSAEQRINQNSPGNGTYQDLTWAEFNELGDLAVCWRDRRSSGGAGYSVPTQIYGRVKRHNMNTFSSEFILSDQVVNHQTILDQNGNDFMNHRFISDTLYAVWGDVRSGELKIYFQKYTTTSGTSEIHEITALQTITIYPNPTDDRLYILEENLCSYPYSLYTSEGKLLMKGDSFPNEGLPLKDGLYLKNQTTQQLQLVIYLSNNQVISRKINIR